MAEGKHTPGQLCPYCEEADMESGRCPACGYFPLPGDGEVTYVKRAARRRSCGCGNPATQRHTYLLEGGRSNPRSSAYGGDDVSWCSDHEEFTCDKCKPPRIDGYRDCSRFSITPDNHRFAHMFLDRKEEPLPLAAAAPTLLAERDRLKEINAELLAALKHCYALIPDDLAQDLGWVEAAISRATVTP